MRSPRSLRAVPVVVVALLATLLGLGAPAAQAQPASEVKQRVYGAINCPHLSRCPAIKMAWFSDVGGEWHYLGQQKAYGGGYSLKLAPGTYHLQFTDQRPSYDVSKFAPTDITVRVRSSAVAKNVTMRPGGAITGSAKAGGRALGSATVVAANQAEQSFATTANKSGQFAVGGLPAGKYCLFTYDHAKRYVGRCTWVGGVNFGQIKNQDVRLTKRAGSLTVFVDTATGKSAPTSNLTVTSKATGQWWTARVRNGKAVFTGVFPSRYRYKYDGGGVWLGATGSVRSGNVHSGKMAFGNVKLTQRGGWVTGSLVDGSAPTYALVPQGTQPGALVMLFDASGTKIAQTTSDTDGNFRLDTPLPTQSGLTVVVDPSNSSGGYMLGGAGSTPCQFNRAEVDGVAVTTNAETFLGDVPVPRTPNSPDPRCATSTSTHAHSTRMSSAAQ